MKLTPKQRRFIDGWIRDINMVLANNPRNAPGLKLQRDWLEVWRQVDDLA